MASKVLVFDKLAFDPATNQFFQLILIDNTTSYSLYVKDVAAPTNPSLASNLTSVGATPVIAPSGAGDVVGLGTTNTIPLWTDGPNSVIGDSVLTQSAGGIIASGKITANNYDCLGSTAPNNGWTVPAANVVAFYTAGVRRASVSSSGVLIGLASTTTGALLLAHSGSAFLTTIQSGNALAARTYTWPTDFGAAGATLTDAAGNGTLSWAVPAAAGANTALSNLAAVAINTALLTGPGIVAAFTTTPAAVTASSTAGVGLTLTADAAVAGNVNNGAAAGGSVTITSGAAARLVSGNANGGAINLTTGAGIGAGVSGNVVIANGQLVVPVGSDTSPSIVGSGTLTTGLRWVNASNITMGLSGNPTYAFRTDYLGVAPGLVAFMVTATDVTSTKDSGIGRVAAGVVEFNNGTTIGQRRWFQWSGQERLTADVTNATATFANLTDLTISNIISGRKYFGRAVIKCNNSTAAEGVKFDFNGGSATVSAFWAAASASVGGTTVLGTVISTSLAGVINFTTITGETLIVIEFSFVASGNGTLILRFAENTTATGTVTAELGSFIYLFDSPN